MSSVVYFVAGKNSIKIGVTRNLRTRFQALCTSSSEDLRLLGSIAGDAVVERKLHDRFAAYRGRGEWFEDSEELRSAITEILGRNVFPGRRVRRAARTKKTEYEFYVERLEAAQERLGLFTAFCLGDARNGDSNLVRSLPLARRHLVMAAFKYAHTCFCECRDEFLWPDSEGQQANKFAQQALAAAEQIECHVEIILGSDYKELLAAWPRQPRCNPHFETNF